MDGARRWSARTPDGDRRNGRRPGRDADLGRPLPGSIDRVLRINADIAGPDLEAGRASVQQIVAAFKFKWTPPAIEDSDADDVLRLLLDGLDRDTRAGHSDFHSCFQREPGRADGVIRGPPGVPLGSALNVTCTSRIEASRAGVWRIVFEVTWPESPGQAGDTIRTELFSTGERLESVTFVVDMPAGYVSSVAGRRIRDAG